MTTETTSTAVDAAPAVAAAADPAPAAVETPPAGTPAATPQTWNDIVAGLPEDLRGTAGKYQSLEDTVKAAAELRKELSRSRDGYVRVPGADAKPEEVAAYRKAMGVPESAAGYGLGVADDAPETEKHKLGQFLELAHGEGLPTGAVKKILDLDRSIRAAEEAQKQRQREESFAAGNNELRQLWGNDWSRDVELSVRAGEHIFGKDGIELLAEAGLDNHPTIIRGLNKAGRAMAPDIPAIAASKQQMQTEFEAVQAEEMKILPCTPEWNDPAWQARRAAAYARRYPNPS
jgi:hypothetical protein